LSWATPGTAEKATANAAAPAKIRLIVSPLVV